MHSATAFARPLMPFGQAQFARAVVRPAGQADDIDNMIASLSTPDATPTADMTVTPQEAGITPTPDTTSGTAGTATGSLFDTASSNPAAATAAATAGMTPAQQTLLFSTIGSGLSTAGATIGSIITSGNNVAIANLQQQTALRIAQLQTSAQQAQAAGNLQLAQQNSAQAASMQQALMSLGLAPSNDTTTLWIVGGVVVLLLAFGGIYLATRPAAAPVYAASAPRASRTTSRSSRRN